MKERIRLIMDNEQLTPSAFADMLQIGRAVMSHILNGRNNPSLEVVTRILSKLPYINPDWLITGEGNMYKSGMKPDQDNFSPSTNNNSPDLFTQVLQTAVNVPDNTVEDKNRKENIVERPENRNEESIKQQVIYQKIPEKKIAKIIIYYTDNTFETFQQDQTHLL